MQKYDKVYVPNDTSKTELYVARCYTHHWEGDVDEKENVIVLSVEELKEMWNRAVELFYGLDVLDIDKKTDEDFKTHLQSKGIILHDTNADKAGDIE